MKLVEPTVELEEQYLDMLADWHQTGEDLIPFPLKYDHSDFPALVQKLLKFKTVSEGDFVCNSTFWLLTEDNTIVGVSNLRHELTEKLLADGGHIGYGVRPSHRRKGYATKMLELTLIEAKKIGIEKALVCCDTENVASAKTITANGGVLWKDYLVDGVKSQKYWIEIA